MKVVEQITLISKGHFPRSSEFKKIQRDVEEAIQAVDWPDGSGTFLIYPESGKKRGRGNGVKPIKKNFIESLERRGWETEVPFRALDLVGIQEPGKLDGAYTTSSGAKFAAEWETGNISSSHRALNKMAIGLMKAKIIGAALIVPSNNLALYLTDRIGNIGELRPYLPLWKSISKSIEDRSAVFKIIVVEHDEESSSVPRIPKGTDGRARG